MRRGTTLVEVLVYLVCFAILSPVVAVTLYQAHDSFRRANAAFDDVEREGFALDAVKRDLREATAVTVSPNGSLTLTRRDGTVVTHAAGSIVFTQEAPRLVRIDLTLPRRNPGATRNAVWSTVVHCRNLP